MSRTCPECHNSYEDEILHCPEDGLDLSTVEPDDELIGRNIGSYRVVKPLGKGGMGAVYMAEHPVIGSRVAIKFLHPQYSTDKKIVDRFFNEARAVNVIGHDNILKILDLNVTEDNRHYFIMEFLYGKPLQDLVKPDVPIPLEVAGPILLQCCEALQAAHDHGIIHRDLKPDNVYLITHKGKKNFVKIVDFGIAKLSDGSGQSTGKTQTGMVMGTPAYMSPEQAGGMTTRIDARSDIYSLGVMMYQMATGKLPFPGQSFGEVLIGHLQLPPPPIREIAPEVPEAYEAVIMKCLAKQQEARQQSMRELHDEIRGVMDSLGISAELPKADPADAKMDAPAQSKMTPSSPGRPSTRAGTPRPKSSPTVAARQQTVAQPPPPPPKSKTGLFVGVGVGALVVLIGLISVVVIRQQQAAERAEQFALDAKRQAAEAAARAASEAAEREKRRLEEEKAPVFLSVVSVPIGARVDAVWEGGSKSGETPLQIEAPRNTKVRFAFSKKDYLPYAQDVIADKPQVVSVTLQPEPKVVAATPSDGSRKDKKKKDADAPPPPPTDDSTIPVEF